MRGKLETTDVKFGMTHVSLLDKVVALLSLVLCQDALNCLLELCVNDIEVFRHDFDIGDGGHEVGIAVPARDDVVVHMFGKTSAGDFALVDAHVEAVGRHQLAQGFEGQLRLRHQFGEGGGIQFFECFDMLKWRYHEMPVVVGVAVKHHKTPLATIENMILGVAVFSWQGTKNAPLWLWCLWLNKGHAPGCP